MYDQINAIGSIGRAEACVKSSTMSLYTEITFMCDPWCRLAFINGPGG